MSDAKHEISMPIRLLPAVIVALLLLSFVGSILLAIYLQPKFIGDAGAYQYKVVITSVWFVLPKKVTAQKQADVHRAEYVYYTNEYFVRKTERLCCPIDFTMSKGAYFKRGEDGNYHLISLNTGASYSPSETLHIAVIEQSNNRVVFNSVLQIAPYLGP